MVGHFYLYDHKFHPDAEGVISPANRSFRYGDGLFETLRFEKGRILLESLHFERLFQGMALMEFTIPSWFTPTFLKEEIIRLLEKNHNPSRARIRLNVFRGSGGILETEDLRPHYLIECGPLPENDSLNENGLIVDVFEDLRKSGDRFSHLKTNNFLVYAMAGIYARKNRINDALILNTNGMVCDSVIANVFVVQASQILTPPLGAGGIGGVMRRWLLEQCRVPGYEFIEREISVQDLLVADELFLTNSIRFLRWVGRFRNRTYSWSVSREIYSRILSTIP